MKKRMIIVALVIILGFGIFAYYEELYNDDMYISNQEVAEFMLNSKFENHDQMTIEVIGVRDNDNYGGTELVCNIYENGKFHQFISINKNYYMSKLIKARENS